VTGHQLGRYVLYDEIASGGMASVHFGRMLGPAGFTRTVAIKRLHAHLARDPQFVTMFLDEARVAARVHHPNVVATIDVVAREGELFLVMEYINGDSLSNLLREVRGSGAKVPPRVVSSIISGVLHGLHAAHEARSEQGEPLQIVHRDVSPQNIIVGTDGIARVVDFGVAKATMRVQSTRNGEVKGKFSYMAPEQLESRKVDRRTDVYAAAVVLWEALASRRLFAGDDPGSIVTAVLMAKVPQLTAIAPELSADIQSVVERGLARNADARFPTALAMALELEKALPAAPQHTVGQWVEACAPERLQERSRRLARIERTPAEPHSPGDVEQSDNHSPLLSPATIRALSEAHTERGAAPVATEGALPPVSATETREGGVTELSLVSERGAIIRQPRRTQLWAGLGVVVLALGGLFIGLRFGHFRRADPIRPAAASRAPAATPSSVPEALVRPVATSDSGNPVAPASEVSATGGAATRAGQKHRANASAQAKNCDPPFTLDAAGVKRFKQWCFK